MGRGGVLFWSACTSGRWVGDRRGPSPLGFGTIIKPGCQPRGSPSGQQTTSRPPPEEAGARRHSPWGFPGEIPLEHSRASPTSTNFRTARAQGAGRMKDPTSFFCYSKLGCERKLPAFVTPTAPAALASSIKSSYNPRPTTRLPPGGVPQPHYRKPGVPESQRAGARTPTR